MAVHPSVPAQTTPEFIAYSKANPGKLNMASQGNGTATHIFGELFNMMAGTNLTHVPYRASFLSDLLGGQVQVAFLPIVQGIDYFRARQLRALGVTGSTRAEALPDVPALAEAVPAYEAIGWQGIGAPKATPAGIIEKLNKATNDVITTPALKSRFADLGAEPMPMTPDEFGKFVAAETDKWAKVVKFAGIKPE
jgi:tripartite-type tricarboxylate transporter receptor subunit TctC